jgi:hypothetical protein
MQDVLQPAEPRFASGEHRLFAVIRLLLCDWLLPKLDADDSPCCCWRLFFRWLLAGLGHEDPMKFSIRDLLLVTVIVALAVGWGVDHWQRAIKVEPLIKAQKAA